MIAALALLLAQAPSVDVGYPLDVFESLCLRGEARFLKGTVKQVAWQDMPHVFRRSFERAELKFSNRAGALRYGLQDSLPGFSGGNAVVSTDGNWAAIVEPKRPGGDQRCAVVARQIDRIKLGQFGVLPFSLDQTRDISVDDMVDQGMKAGTYPGAIVRIKEFGKMGALVQAYIMTPEAAEADRKTSEANHTKTTFTPSNRLKKED